MFLFSFLCCVFLVDDVFDRKCHRFSKGFPGLASSFSISLINWGDVPLLIFKFCFQVQTQPTNKGLSFLIPHATKWMPVQATLCKVIADHYVD